MYAQDGWLVSNIRYASQFSIMHTNLHSQYGQEYPTAHAAHLLNLYVSLAERNGLLIQSIKCTGVGTSLHTFTMLLGRLVVLVPCSASIPNKRLHEAASTHLEIFGVLSQKLNLELGTGCCLHHVIHKPQHIHTRIFQGKIKNFPRLETPLVCSSDPTVQ
jgi:hypothetical protein